MGQFDARPAPLPPFPDRGPSYLCPLGRLLFLHASSLVAPKPVLPPPPMLSTQAQQVRPTVPPPPMRPLAPPMLPIQSASGKSDILAPLGSLSRISCSSLAAVFAVCKHDERS